MTSIFGQDKSTQSSLGELLTQRSSGFEDLKPMTLGNKPQNSPASFSSHLEAAREDKTPLRGKKARDTSTDPVAFSDSPKTIEEKPLRKPPKAIRSPNKNEAQNDTPPYRTNTEERTSSIAPRKSVASSPDTGERAKGISVPPSTPLKVNRNEILQNIRQPQNSTLQNLMSDDKILGLVPSSIMNIPLMTELDVDSDNLLTNQILSGMQALGMMLGGKDRFMQESPILALLGGQIENISPQNLPSIISNSPLMQSALGAQKTGDIFHTPQPIGDLLQQLGLDKSPIFQSVQASGLLQAEGTLAGILQALGFDPSALEKTAAKLSETVQSGLLPDLMVRIAQLKDQDLQEPSSDMKDRSLLHAHNTQQRSAEEPLLAYAGFEQTIPFRKNTEVSESKSTNKDHAELWESNQDNRHPLIHMMLPNEASPSSGAQALMNFMMSQAPNSPSLKLASSAELPEQTPLPEILLASSDPFAAIAQQWQGQDLLSFDFTNQMIKEPFAAQVLEPSSPNEASLTAPNELIFSTPSGQGFMMEAMDTQLNNINKNTLQMSEFSPELSQANTTTIISDDTIPQDFLSSDQQGFGSGTKDAQNPITHAAANKFDSNTSFTLGNSQNTQQSQPALSTENIQKIFERASMMVKEGGGSIRIDLGDQGLGNVDLALDIKDSTVELRILTNSPQARELLSQELPRLRESLLQQNLNLEKVEIGLGGGSAWSQSSEQGQSQGQRYEWSEQSSYRSPQGTRNVRTYNQSSSTRQIGVNPLHKGLIQVRV